MDTIKNEMNDVVDDIKDFVNVSAELYKLKATEKGAAIASTAIINIILGVFASLVLVFISFAIAFGIAEMTGKIYLGFLIVAGFYALACFIILITKDKWLKSSLVDTIIKSIYSH
ncbi:MAG: phage holin family protein [Bacteroidetes bacterium]|nr:phage holin family protein [Bacteroidota bacterium]